MVSLATCKFFKVGERRVRERERETEKERERDKERQRQRERERPTSLVFVSVCLYLNVLRDFIRHLKAIGGAWYNIERIIL